MLRKAMVVALLLAGTVPAFSAKITLDKAWVKKHMNQVTTSIGMDVMDVKPAPNAPVDDGDIHMGGKSEDAGLPLVAEIMNAGLPPQAQALKFAQDHKGKSIHVTGAWRLWFEHPPTGADDGQVQAIQGEIKMTRPGNVKAWTNPDHMFEVHPITKFENGQTLEIANSVHMVDGIKQYDPKKVFPFYEGQVVTISETAGDSGTITMESSKSQYNYVIFLVSLQGNAVQTETQDGFLAYAEIFDWQGNLIPLTCSAGELCVRRMVIPNDTEPYTVLKLDKTKAAADVDGQCYQVLGIPRINLERVNYVLQHSDQYQDGSVFLPYEMILVGAKASNKCKVEKP